MCSAAQRYSASSSPKLYRPERARNWSGKSRKNSMTMPDPIWHTSTYSAQSGSCVEVAEGSTVLVRDTRHRELGHLGFGSAEWRAFIQGVRSGEL
ncbi:DUF397 domain-containing protein [Nocardiopsis mangrovi]|uniref:DUF397 domain-containing protein n=1 Tax=Nocardiopsis mangrovi TaxID=1179818 RepID=A0ABV9E0C2_9ACTN